MLQNANLLAKIGADTAENEQTFAKKLVRLPIRQASPDSDRPERVKTNSKFD